MEQEGNIGDGRGEEETIVGFIWETESPSVRVTRLMRPRRERGMADADVPQWALDCCDSTAWRVVRSSRALCAALDAAFALQPAAARPQRPFAAADSRSQRTAAWAVTPVATRDAVQAALNAALACPAVRASTAFRALLWPPSTDAADDGADARADLSADEAREQMLCRVPPLPTVRLYAIQAAGPGGAGQQQQMEAPPPRTIARWRLHVTMVQAAQGLPQGRLYCTVALDKTVWETPAVVDTAPLWNNTHSFYIAENVGTLVFAVRERRVLQRSRCLGTFALDLLTAIAYAMNERFSSSSTSTSSIFVIARVFLNSSVSSGLVSFLAIISPYPFFRILLFSSCAPDAPLSALLLSFRLFPFIATLPLSFQNIGKKYRGGAAQKVRCRDR